MQPYKHIKSRLLPKTGQSVSYVGDDDGDYEKGWWEDAAIAANRIRFVAVTLLGDEVVIDRATGLLWPADKDGWGCFNGGTKDFALAILWAESLNFAGFNDWRIPNVNELNSILDWSNYNPMVDTNFFSAYNASYGTSTSNGKYTASYETVHFGIGYTTERTKSSVYRVRAVRSYR